MAIIGTFARAKNGGWEGAIRTLTMTAKVRFVPNDNRDTETAPDYRVVSGTSELGVAWLRRTSAGATREYLSVQLDDPGFAGAMSAALFIDENNQTANLVWNRRRLEA